MHQYMTAEIARARHTELRTAAERARTARAATGHKTPRSHALLGRFGSAWAHAFSTKTPMPGKVATQL